VYGTSHRLLSAGFTQQKTRIGFDGLARSSGETTAMFRKRTTRVDRSDQPATDVPTALDVTSEYVAALTARDSVRMNGLRSPDFVLDFVHGDASEASPLPNDDTRQFWSAWFVAFPELDFEVTRTVAAETVVVTQWTFTGTNSGPLPPLGIDGQSESAGKTVRLRGISVYDIGEGLIRHETAYIDLATLMVELGVEF
jgi:steroid delta-isomerase-like uncharacterized protein